MTRRLPAFACAAALVFSLAACAPEAPPEEPVSTLSMPSAASVVTSYFDGVSTAEIDPQAIWNAVETGVFEAKDTNGDPVEVTLGMTETPVRETFEATGELFESEGDTYKRFYTGYTQLYVLREQPSAGVIAIVHSDTAFGFEINITNRESIEAVLGAPTAAGIATAAQAEILFDPTVEATRLVYERGGNRLEFFLVDNALAATCLSSKALWQR